MCFTTQQRSSESEVSWGQNCSQQVAWKSFIKDKWVNLTEAEQTFCVSLPLYMAAQFRLNINNLHVRSLLAGVLRLIFSTGISHIVGRWTKIEGEKKVVQQHKKSLFFTKKAVKWLVFIVVIVQPQQHNRRSSKVHFYFYQQRLHGEKRKVAAELSFSCFSFSFWQ